MSYRSMHKQKYHRGDLVHIAADLGSHKRHFAADIDALIIDSFANKYDDPTATGTYSLMLLPKDGKPYYCSWYCDNELTLVKKRTLASIGRVEKLGRNR